MANSTYNAKDYAGNSVAVAVDSIAGVDWPYVKLVFGTAGTATVIDASNPLPVLSPAASRTTDSINAALASDALMVGTSALAPNFSALAASSSGATTIVSAVASKKIRVLGLAVVCAGAVNFNLQSHTTTTQKTGTFPFAANSGISIPFSPVGWFETVAGEALDVNLGGAVVVGGLVTYITV